MQNKNFIISKSRRLRSTPFTSRLEKQGVTGYTVYNHMLLPTFFDSIEDEYNHLKKDVQVWDVSVQREIEFRGKDSYKLVQLMTCRNLSNAKINKCYYVPLIDAQANMVNDPLIMKIDDSTWRVCIADSDVSLFAKGLASGFNLDVDVEETDISTLAIQGPKSEKLMDKVFGKKILDLKFFCYDYFNYNGEKFLVSKSGYSKQGGYEIHIENLESGLKLYDYLFKIGKDLNIKPGCPNLIERIEAALLSYGNDMDNRDNPYECGFDKYINLDANIDFIGKESLKRIKLNGIKKKLMGVKIDMSEINLSHEVPIYDKDTYIGSLRSAAYSPKFNKVIGIAMINLKYCNEKQEFTMKLNGKTNNGKIYALPLK